MATEKIGRAVLELATDSAKFFSDLAKAKQEGRALGSEFEKNGQGVKSFGAQLTGLGTIAKTVFGAGALGGIVAVGLDFEKATGIIVKGTGATGAALKGLQADMRAVLTQVPQSADVVATALTDLHRRLGLTGTALQTATKLSLDFARVNGVEVADATRTVSQLMNDLGISADRLPEVLDKLTAAAQASGIKVDRLAELVGSADDALQEMGFGLDESIALFAAFEKAGAEPEGAIKALTIAMRNMAKEGVTDAHQALTILLDKIKTAPTLVEATKIAVQTFGKSGVTMAGDIRSGKLEIDGMMKILENSKGTLERTADASKTTTEKLSQLFNTVKLGIEPFGTFLLSLGAVPFAVTSVAGGLKSLGGYFLSAGAAGTTGAAGVRTFSLAFFGPLGLIAALGGAALAFTYFKGSEIKETTDKLVAAGDIVKRVVHNLGEAKAIIDAFEKGQKGEKITLPFGPLSMDLAKAWEAGAIAAGKLQTNTDGATVSLKAFAPAAQKLTADQKAAAAAAEALSNSEVKLSDGVKKAALQLLAHGYSAEETFKILKDGFAVTDDAKKAIDHLADGYKKAADIQKKYNEVLEKSIAASKPLTTLQQEEVRRLEALGMAHGDIAIQIHASEIQVSNFVDAMKASKEVMEEILAVADRVNDLRFTHIDTRNLSGLAPMIDTAAAARASSTVKQINDATWNDIEGRMRSHGVFTRAELERQAAEFKQEYEDMKASGLFTYDELAAAAKRSADAQDAAFGDSFKKISARFHSLGQLFLDIGAMSDGAFGRVVTGIGHLVDGIGDAVTAVGNLKKALTFENVTGLISAGVSIGKMIADLTATPKYPGGVLSLRRGWLGDILGTNTQGRQLIQQFADAHGGFDKLHALMLKTIPDAERLWKILTQTISNADPVAARAAIQSIQDALANSPATLAEAAGYQTRAQLQETADKAKAVYDYMLKSGQYTASQLADAFQKSKDAQIAAMDDTSRAAYDAAIKARDAAKTVLDELDGQIKSLQTSIASEAPEEFMGLVEQQQRADLARLEAKRAQKKEELDEAERQIQTAVDNSVAAAQAAATAAGAATVNAIQDALDRHDFRVNVNVQLNGLPGSELPEAIPMASGGYGRVLRPTLFAAGLHGPEDFAFSGENKSFRSSGMTASGSATAPSGDVYNVTINGNVDSDDRAKQLVREFSQEVRKGGKSRSMVLGAIGLHPSLVGG
jgi:TP901 family phage tail tape measure protein